MRLYYSTENTREFKEVDEQFLEVGPVILSPVTVPLFSPSCTSSTSTSSTCTCIQVGEELAPAVEHLITSYPAWTRVESLPLDSLEERMRVVSPSSSVLLLLLLCSSR